MTSDILHHLCYVLRVLPLGFHDATKLRGVEKIPQTIHRLTTSLLSLLLAPLLPQPVPLEQGTGLAVPLPEVLRQTLLAAVLLGPALAAAVDLLYNQEAEVAHRVTEALSQHPYVPRQILVGLSLLGDLGLAHFVATTEGLLNE